MFSHDYIISCFRFPGTREAFACTETAAAAATRSPVHERQRQLQRQASIVSPETLRYNEEGPTAHENLQKLQKLSKYVKALVL